VFVSSRRCHHLRRSFDRSDRRRRPRPVVHERAGASANAEAVEPESPTRFVESGLDLDDVRARFVERVVPRTSRGAQLLLKSAFVRSLDGQHLTIALPSEEMRQNTELIAQGLRSAMEHEFKSPLQITWPWTRHW